MNKDYFVTVMVSALVTFLALLFLHLFAGGVYFAPPPPCGPEGCLHAQVAERCDADGICEVNNMLVEEGGEVVFDSSENICRIEADGGDLTFTGCEKVEVVTSDYDYSRFLSPVEFRSDAHFDGLLNAYYEQTVKFGEGSRLVVGEEPLGTGGDYVCIGLEGYEGRIFRSSFPCGGFR